LDYQVVIQGKMAVVMLSGDIDLYFTPDARRVILRCLSEKNGVLVDLSAVTYIDSSGIACLVEGYQTAKQQQLRFGLVGVSENAMNVLRLTRLDQVFPVHDSLAAALAHGG
jgi:anti-sigma B factor antagonist